MDECKTEGSAKTFVLAEDLLARLRAWKQASRFPAPSDWVFASPMQFGKLPWSYTGTRTEIARAANATGLGHINTHSFRHYAEFGMIDIRTARGWIQLVRPSAFSKS